MTSTPSAAGTACSSSSPPSSSGWRPPARSRRRVVGVTAGTQGAYASAALLDGPNVQQVPEWLSAAEGIAMYFPYLLSYLALRVRGRVGPGDVVLVHAAAGGAGSAAVQLAKSFGATVIATAGTDDKVAFCRTLGADYGVNY